MNCQQARELLPDHLYQAVPAPRQAELEQHLSQCPACADVWRGLQGVRQALDTAPEPEVHVDLAAVYREAQTHERRQLLRWRRLAWAASAAAAVLLIVLGLRFEIHWQDRQLVIGWGAAPQRPQVEGDRPVASLEADLQFVKELIHAVAADVERRDDERLDGLLTLQDRIDRLAASSNRRWQDTQNDFRALYTAYFGDREKGATP